ncbi:MAG: hypothetical protein LBQ40_04640 [Clostridiales bacterium]|jgi:hypothetical protein|nr:hypothetical protein [Clostridiales bacterium]
MRANQINYKRVLLFIVEGATEKITLENVFKKNFADKKICFKIVGGDITAEDSTTEENAESKIYACVRDFLSRNGGFKRSDITEIIHLTDLDGAFVSDKRIVFNGGVDLAYEERFIESNKTYKIIERNKRKSAVLSRLSTLGHIRGISYSVYYFSSNIEHVLYGKKDCGGAEKESLAYEFAKDFTGRETTFCDFLTGQGVAVDLDYARSWEAAGQGVASLKRRTNINLLFDRINRRKDND